MKLSELKKGTRLYTQLDYRVLAVLVIDDYEGGGWRMYIGAVPGNNHAAEWPAVASNGTKAREPVARAIAEHYFHPGFRGGFAVRALNEYGHDDGPL